MILMELVNSISKTERTTDEGKLYSSEACLSIQSRTVQKHKRALLFSGITFPNKIILTRPKRTWFSNCHKHAYWTWEPYIRTSCISTKSYAPYVCRLFGRDSTHIHRLKETLSCPTKVCCECIVICNAYNVQSKKQLLTCCFTAAKTQELRSLNHPALADTGGEESYQMCAELIHVAKSGW